jgi:hypothetical protein
MFRIYRVNPWRARFWRFLTRFVLGRSSPCDEVRSRQLTRVARRPTTCPAARKILGATAEATVNDASTAE